MSMIDMQAPGMRDKVIVATVIYALSIEITTSMKASRGAQPVAVAKRYGFTGRTKIKALVFMVNVMQELDPAYVLSATVRRTLKKAGYVQAEPVAPPVKRTLNPCYCDSAYHAKGC